MSSEDSEPFISKAKDGGCSITGFLIVTCCLVVIAFLLYLLIFGEDLQLSRRLSKKNMSCRTSSCHLMASQLRAAASMSVFPYMDFYQHSCGGWVNTNPAGSSISWEVSQKFANKIQAILENRTPQRITQTYLDMVIILFQSCQAAAKDALPVKMRKVFEQFNLHNWPRFAYTDSESYDIFKEVMNADFNYRMMLVFEFGRSWYWRLKAPVLSIRHSLHSCPFRGISDKQRVNRYKQYVKRVLELFDNHDEVAAEEIVNIRISLCMASFHIPGASYGYYSFETLVNSTVASGVQRQDWLGALNHPMIDLSEKSVIYTNIAYVAAAVDLLKRKSTPESTMRFLGFMVLSEMASTHEGVNKALADFDFLNAPILNYVLDVHPCTRVLIGEFTMAWNLFSISVANPNNTVTADIFKVLNATRAAAIQTIRLSHWMDDVSKSRTISKLKRAVVVFPCFSSFMRNYNLSERYANLEAFSYDFYDNMLMVHKNDASYALSGPARDFDDPNFALAGGYADQSSNTIVLYAGLLQPPYYAYDLPIASKFAGLGSVAARHFAQLVTGRGAKVDERSSTGFWWSGETYQSYRSRANCFAHQSNSEVAHFERAGHLSYYLGAQIAFRAFQHALADAEDNKHLVGYKMTDDQLFFRTLCLVLCASWDYDDKKTLSEYMLRRCNGAVLNMPEFAKGFRCKKASEDANSVLNPEVRCELY